MLVEQHIKGYKHLHARLRKKHKIPDECSNCKVKGKVDLANKTGKYLEDISDWEWLCRSCHMTKDGRLSNLTKGRWKTKSYCSCGKQAVTRNGVCMKKYNCLRRHKQPCSLACQ